MLPLIVSEGGAGALVRFARARALPRLPLPYLQRHTPGDSSHVNRDRLDRSDLDLDTRAGAGIAAL